MILSLVLLPITLHAAEIDDVRSACTNIETKFNKIYGKSQVHCLFAAPKTPNGVMVSFAVQSDKSVLHDEKTTKKWILDIVRIVGEEIATLEKSGIKIHGVNTQDKQSAEKKQAIYIFRDHLVAAYDGLSSGKVSDDSVYKQLKPEIKYFTSKY